MNEKFQQGKYTYLVLDVIEEDFIIKAGDQMRAARKLERAMKLPHRWYLKLRENGKTIDWWVFNELGEVVAPGH